MESHDGKLTWSLDVDGKTLLQSGTDKVSASVTTTDAAGNTFSLLIPLMITASM
ncbi:hypothetical protein [Photobacterium leiognathi]|uniref:hypothetical protein n=1 Tax=Photobacterium leiognathi TaxID=553611 RepID=UPI0027347BDE|nr:hypothetical protein [Photobacterium leiognathi]